jgi:uncharacterized protein YqfA (UPF0365 family)
MGMEIERRARMTVLKQTARIVGGAASEND